MAKFILSKSKVLEQYKKVREISDSVSFSVKTNPTIAEILENETDCSLGIHTGELLDNIKDKKRVWYFLQGNNEAQLRNLFQQGVSNFVVDNVNDLNLLLNFIKNHKNRINLMLRMKLKEHTIHTGKHFVFGMSTKRINELMPDLRKHKNIEKLGIHFHRKTQNISEWSLKYELEQSLIKETLQNVDFVDIGGGLPIEYKNYNAEIEPIFAEIKKLREWLNKNNIKMIIEPGRFIAAPSVKLEAEIINIYDSNIVVDCSVYNGAMDTFLANVRLKIEGELEQGQGEEYTIKGRTPDSLDIFRYKVYLKKKRVGDKIVFLNAGAYNFCSDFCGLKKIETVIED